MAARRREGCFPGFDVVYPRLFLVGDFFVGDCVGLGLSFVALLIYLFVFVFVWIYGCLLYGLNPKHMAWRVPFV